MLNRAGEGGKRKEEKKYTRRGLLHYVILESGWIQENADAIVKTRYSYASRRGTWLVVCYLGLVIAGTLILVARGRRISRTGYGGAGRGSI